jgi:SpoIVB peptidase S55
VIRRSPAAVLAALAALACAATAQAADPILPLSEVRPGMTGIARTVVQGTTITTFPVTIIDVQKVSDGPGGALIFIRAEGPLMDRTGGIAQGMSGSPVYVTGADGVARVIGAVAFGTGDENNRIGGITPIEAMVRSGSGKLALERIPAGAPRRAVVRVASKAAARRLEGARPGARAVYPLQRWTIAGVSRGVVAPLQKTLARSGVRLESTGGRSQRAPVPLEPGSSMTALLAGGDIVVGAIGTVTYVDGPMVYGFGHPFLNTGPSQFLLGDGYVYDTIPAPIQNGSYKLGEPGTLHGMIVGDRSDGVVGRIEPVKAVRVVSSARDTLRESAVTVTTLLAPDERTMPEITDVLQAEPAFRVRDGIGGGTLTLKITVKSPRLAKPFVYRNVYAAAGDVVNIAIGPLTRVVTILTQNGVLSVPITEITVDQVIEPRVRAARIVDASIAPKKLRPGQPARLRLLIQPWRGARRVISVPFRAPFLPEGPSRLRVVPFDPQGFDPAPPQLSDQLNGETTAARARTILRGLQDELGVAPQRSPVRRVVNALDAASRDRHDAVRLLAPGEDESDPNAGLTIPVPWVIYGGRATPRLVMR